MVLTTLALLFTTWTLDTGAVLGTEAEVRTDLSLTLYTKSNPGGTATTYSYLEGEHHEDGYVRGSVDLSSDSPPPPWSAPFATLSEGQFDMYWSAGSVSVPAQSTVKRKWD